MVKKAILLVVLLFSGIMPVKAQEEVEVRATVNYPAVNLRDAPNAQSATRWRGTSNIVAVLAEGEEVIVQALEAIDYYYDDYGYTWVYVTVPGRNLSGWIVGEYLTFERVDWDDFVPHLRTWDELIQYTAIRLPGQGFAGIVANAGGGGYYYFPLFDDPVQQNLVANIPVETPIIIYGRSEIDTRISRYVYIRSQDGQYEGWISAGYIGEVLSNSGTPYTDYYQALPVIYAGTTDAKEIHPYGVVEITAVNLRSTPGTDAPIQRELPYQTHLALHSTTSHEKETAWIYVTVAETGESGWVFGKYLLLQAPEQ